MKENVQVSITKDYQPCKPN